MNEETPALVRDAISARWIRRMFLVLLGLQILVGQALPLSAARPLNPIAQGLSDTFTRHPAEIISWVAAACVVIGAFSRKGQLVVGVGYGIYTIAVSILSFRIDPYVGVLYALYAASGVVVAVTARERSCTS